MNMPKQVVIEQATKVAGYFKLEVIRADGTIKSTHEFKNLVLNAGLDRWAINTADGFCHVGTGSATPAITDVALQSKYSGIPICCWSGCWKFNRNRNWLEYYTTFFTGFDCR